MIEVTKILNISAQDFFDVIEESLYNDMQKTSNQVNIESGMSYKKNLKNKLGQLSEVEICIEKYERPNIYSSKIQKSKENNYITYEVNKIDENNIEVKYTEDYIAHNKMKNLNYKAILVLYKKKSIKRMTMIIENIERYAKRKESELCQD